MPRIGPCSCKQYNVPCDDECNCCDSPYAIEDCDCECSQRKAQHVAEILKEIIDDGGLTKLQKLKWYHQCGRLPQGGITVHTNKENDDSDQSKD